MAWTDTAIPILRVLINDPIANMYSNDRLKDVLSASGYLLTMEVDFDTSYTVNVTTNAISPDPSSDKDFMTLLTLRSAVFIYSGELKDAVNNTILVKDGLSTVDTGNKAKNAEIAYEKMLDMYNEAKRQFTLGNSSGVQAILSPYTSSNVSIGSNLR